VKRLLVWLLLTAACSRSKEALLLLDVQRAGSVPPLSRITVQAGGRTAEWSGDVPARTQLWVNPPLGTSTPPPIPEADLAGTDFRFDRVRLQASGVAAYIDEIRLGTTFASVTPAAP
jgi:hypothetical protein